jgi:hypothetical protein
VIEAKRRRGEEEMRQRDKEAKERSVIDAKMRRGEGDEGKERSVIEAKR